MTPLRGRLAGANRAGSSARARISARAFQKKLKREINQYRRPESCYVVVLALCCVWPCEQAVTSGRSCQELVSCLPDDPRTANSLLSRDFPPRPASQKPSRPRPPRLAPLLQPTLVWQVSPTVPSQGAFHGPSIHASGGPRGVRRLREMGDPRRARISCSLSPTGLRWACGSKRSGNVSMKRAEE